MNSKQPEITASLDTNGTAIISIQLAGNVKIVLAVADGGYVSGKIIGAAPKAAVLDDAKFRKMVADEQRDLQAQIDAGHERNRRANLGLSDDHAPGRVEYQTDSHEHMVRKEMDEHEALVKNFGRRAS
jgi:hypothetical protein